MSSHRPLIFFFVSFRNHQCPFWNHCFNKQQIMRRRLQNKRASQLRPLNSERKHQEFLWGAWPPTTTRSFASRMRPLSIFDAFDMPRFSNPCRDSKHHRYNFEFLEQSPVNNKQINDVRCLCAIQQEGKPECSIAAKQRTLGSKRKSHRICPSTSRTSRPCLHAPAACHHPDSPSIPTRKDGVS